MCAIEVDIVGIDLVTYSTFDAETGADIGRGVLEKGELMTVGDAEVSTLTDPETGAVDQVVGFVEAGEVNGEGLLGITLGNIAGVEYYSKI